MPIPATCQCGKQYMMKEEFAGKRAKCPECGRMVQVPELPPGAAPGGEPTPAVPEPQGMSGRKMLFIAGGVNVACLIGLIGFIVWLNSDESSQAVAAPARNTAKSPAAPAPAAPVSPANVAPTGQPTPAATPAAAKPRVEAGTQVAAKPAPAVVTPSVAPAPSVTPTPVTPAPTPAAEVTPAPVAPVAPPATRDVPAKEAPAAAAAGEPAILKAESNGGTMRMPAGQVLRVELPPKIEPPVFVSAKLTNNDGKAVQELGQDKEAEKNGVYAWSFKGLEVGTAYLNVTFSDIDPAKGAPTKKWTYTLTIKVRDGAPAGGAFTPPPPPRKPPAAPPARE